MKTRSASTLELRARRWGAGDALVASFCLCPAACASAADDSPRAQMVVPGSSGAGGAAAIPASDGAGTTNLEPGVAGMKTGGAGGAAQPAAGGAGGGAGPLETGMGGGAGDVAIGGAAPNPDLDALLREGIGDVVRPPPYQYGPYSKKRDDVPHGTVKQFTYKDETFWPNAPARGVKVFEPAQYEAGKEVALAVFCDGTADWAYMNDAPDGGD